jgi:hypothetical protein
MLDCPEEATVEIDAAQLSRVAELPDLLDRFLRGTDGVVDRLTDYLHDTGRDQSQPPHWAGHDAKPALDQVSFAAHALRAYRPSVCDHSSESTPFTDPDEHRAAHDDHGSPD